MVRELRFHMLSGMVKKTKIKQTKKTHNDVFLNPFGIKAGKERVFRGCLAKEFNRFMHAC